MKWLFINAVPLACVIAAGVLSYADKPGWGWLILIAALTAVYPGKA